MEDYAVTKGTFSTCLLIYFAVLLDFIMGRVCGLTAGCGALWAGGYFVSTVERISESTVVKYIEELKND